MGKDLEKLGNKTSEESGDKGEIGGINGVWR